MDPAAPGPDTAAMYFIDDPLPSPQYRSSRYRLAAGASTALAVVAGLVASFLIEVDHLTSCGSGADPISLRIELALVWLVAAAVPAAWAVRRRRDGQPGRSWSVVAGALALLALLLGATAQPFDICFTF